MNKAATFILGLMLVSLGACSTKQTYNSLMSWQRNECNKRIDSREREQCLKQADQSYDDYNEQRTQ